MILAMRFDTRALRIGQEPDPLYRAVIPPIYQSSTFEWVDLDHIPPIDYTRCANPNRSMIEGVIASLENGEYCQYFASGMAAIMAVFSTLKAGDHLVLASDIYGGTFRLAEKYLPRYGITYSDFNAHDPASLAAAIQPNTKLIMFETPSNPNLRVCDIAAVTKVAKEHGITTCFDNTFASPALQNPLDLGVDVVVHSTTKYIGGHSDIIGGAVITNDKELDTWFFEWNKAIGSVPSPFDCWLALRGVKTMAIRMKAHCQNALAIAHFLSSHPKVARAHYPGLPDHPDHEIATKQMPKGYGGMLAFELKSVEAARKVAESTDIFLLAESLGGVESLMAYPPLMSHATMTEAQRMERGIPPTMLRLSVGIEDVDDLIEDLAQALELV
jgi:cystathionine beta-lyase/cystathionine gamma-synthase